MPSYILGGLLGFHLLQRDGILRLPVLSLAHSVSPFCARMQMG